MKRLALLLAMAGLFAAPALQACPPPLSRQELQQLDAQEDLSRYILLRWLVCGPETALPALPLLRDALRDQARQDDGGNDSAEAPDGKAEPVDEFVQAVLFALSINPQVLASDDFLDRKDAAEGAAGHLAALLAWPAGTQQMTRHFEQGLAPAIAFLRQEPLSPAIEQQLELILVAQEIRQGRIEQARKHFARVSADAATAPQGDPDAAADAAERLKQMAAVLAPVHTPSLAAATQRWVVDNSTGYPLRRRCGTGAWFAAIFSLDYLRDAILRRADPDAAIAEVLQGDWRSQIGGDGGRTGFLVELLRKRYPPAALKLAWDDALASIHSEDDTAGLNLFGHYLALPSAVLEGDATLPGSARERAPSVAELAEMVRRSALYRETYDAGR